MTDEEQIKGIIQAQFSALKWGADIKPNWPNFEAGFTEEAYLIPAKRPAKPISIFDFIQRMEGLRKDGSLESFSEQEKGTFIKVVGNIAIALAGCEMTENKAEVTKDISAFLLVKTNGEWSIAAQAWDVVEDFNALA